MPSEAEFLRFVLSREGQTVIDKDGYIPLPVRVALVELERLQ